MYIQALPINTFKPGVRKIANPSQQHASPKFGACVNRGTSAMEAIDMIMQGNLRTRIHIIAEMGRSATADLAGVLADLIIGKKDKVDLQSVMTSGDDDLKKVTIISIMEAFQKGNLSAEEKKKLLGALKEAAKKGYMQKHKQLIQDVIGRLEGTHHHDTAAIKDAQHRYQHATNQDHHHGGGGGHKH
jgi:hypothetical protein